MYKAYITTLTNVRKHPNADRLLLADVFGTTVCVSTNYVEGQVGIYFPCDGQLSVEFAEVNNLLRKKDENGNNIGGYMDPEKRNVTAIRLRGEKSDGLFLPISSLNYCYKHNNASTELHIGDVIDGILNGHEICCKYIPYSKEITRNVMPKFSHTHKTKIERVPLFKEHADTEQLAYNLCSFKPEDEIEITLKMHGTSQRTGYLPVLKGYNDSAFCIISNYFKNIMNKISKKKAYIEKHDGKPVYEWDYVTGTRRVVLDSYDGGFYGNNQFREQHAQIFNGKLNKGETVYYEVVGFTDAGTPIMPSANNDKLQDKEFIKRYGKETVFSYGCSPNGKKVVYGKDDEGHFELIEDAPKSELYVYRMTITNEDGFIVEYSPDFMRYRCKQMGVKTVPVMWKGIIPANPASFTDPTITAGEWVLEKAEGYYDGPDPVGITHIREGVVVRIINRPKFTAYKIKNWSFKCLEGLVKAEANEPDIEEAQEING